jgi:predicted nuclease of predicted toxin-antitoxin system
MQPNVFRQEKPRNSWRRTLASSFAIDACVPRQLVEELHRLGADVVYAADRPAMPDTEILDVLHEEGRVLITNDKDFGDLVFRDRRDAPGVVLIRFDIVSDESARDTAARILSIENCRGMFTVLERAGTRQRPVPS